MSILEKVKQIPYHEKRSKAFGAISYEDRLAISYGWIEGEVRLSQILKGFNLPNTNGQTVYRMVALTLREEYKKKNGGI